MNIAKPIRRNKLRAFCGNLYYGTLRRISWLGMQKSFARDKAETPLPYLFAKHKTPLLRKLSGVDMQLQYNKITNLHLAAEKLNGIILHPGETLSYWYLIGNPTSRKGYLEGMLLKNGQVVAGTGGGLCQLSNLIFWITLHTPLTVTERHRHGYDVFPDSNRTQPFGSGATCYYPHGDLMIKNTTENDFQLLLSLDDEFLHGEWRCTASPQYKYEIVERDHLIKSEYWGGYSRHNRLFRMTYDLSGNLLTEEPVVENHAIMMYSPFLPQEQSAPQPKTHTYIK